MALNRIKNQQPTGTLVTTPLTPQNGQILIGNGYDFSLSNLIGGSNVSITNSSGGITISVPSMGLSQFIESGNTSVPNDIIPIDAFIATDASYADIDVALVAKGIGATLAQVPDGTVAGGNKRGLYATDLQKTRGVASAVASGAYSVVVGGQTNTASAFYTVATGGASNTASSHYSFVGGGQSNTASTDTHATVCGGESNTASSQHAFIGGGTLNISSGSASTVGGGAANTASGGRSVVCGGAENNTSGGWSVISGGQNNRISSTYSVVTGGFQNEAQANFSFIAGGTYGITRSITGYHVFPACNAPIASTKGVTQSGLLLLGRQTTGATATTLTSDSSPAGGTNQVILPNNSAYFFKGSIIAGVTGGGNTSAWEFKGAIKRGANAASTSIINSVILDRIAYDAGASTWSVSITADTVYGGLAVTVAGQAATTIRWVCKIETTEMTY